MKKSLILLSLSNKYFPRFIKYRSIDALNRLDRGYQQDYQLKRLRLILSWAYKTVPYWHDLLMSLALDNDRIANLGFHDFIKIPPLTKESIKANSEKLYHKDWVQIRHLDLITSGSGGAPTVTKINYKDLKNRNLPYEYYFLSNFNMANIGDLGNFLNAPHLKIIGTPLEDKILEPHSKDYISRLAGFIKANSIKGVFTYFSKMALLAEALEKEKLDLDLNFAVGLGETLLPNLRSYLERVFRCPVYSAYSSSEIGLIGYECSQKDGFHINLSTVLLEIVDESGVPVNNGDFGSILATSFENHLMPFVRYDLGDYGRWVQEECVCGLKTPRIYFEGRALHFLRLPGGTKYPVLNIITLFDQYYYDYVRQIQIIQESLDKIVLRIVPTNLYNERGDTFFIRAALDRINCGKPLSVLVEKVAEIPKLPSGKSQVFISKIN